MMVNVPFATNRMWPNLSRNRPECSHFFCYQCLVTWSRVKLECPKCKQPLTEFHNQAIGSPENGKFDQLYSFSEVDRYRKYIRNLQKQSYHVLQFAILLAEREIACGLSEQSDDVFNMTKKVIIKNNTNNSLDNNSNGNVVYCWSSSLNKKIYSRV